MHKYKRQGLPRIQFGVEGPKDAWPKTFIRPVTRLPPGICNATQAVPGEGADGR